MVRRENHGIVAEYALPDTNTPIGISRYTLSETLPDDLQQLLPTAEVLELQLAGVGTSNADDKG